MKDYFETGEIQNICCITPFVIHLHNPGAGSQIWHPVKDINAVGKELFLKKTKTLKTFQGNRARNGTHGHIQIEKERFHLIKNLPAPSNINDIYYWLHFHLSSCSNYLLGWYNIK